MSQAASTTQHTKSRFITHSVFVLAFVCGTAMADTSTPVRPSTTNFPPAPTNITLAPLGQPRILISNADLLQRLRTLLNGGNETATRFKTMVDRQLAGADYWGFDNWNAALLSQVTGSSSYCTYAVNQVDAFVRAEEQKIAASQQPVIADDDYLDVGGYITDLALTYDWCRPQMTTSMRSRWVTYANQAVFNAWYRHTNNYTDANGNNPPFVGSDLQPINDYSPWGANNPKNNYYYSFLSATMFLGLATKGENPQADNWLGQFRTAKYSWQLYPVFTADLVGGGSREGTGYGTALRTLFKLYYWWEMSTGERLADRIPHTKLSLAAMMHNIVPTLDRYSITGDQSRDSTGMLFDYQLDYMKVLMQLYSGSHLSGLSGIAKTLISEATPSTVANAFMFYSDYLYNMGNVTARPLNKLAVTYYGSGTGLFATRGGWTPDAAYGNFICGPNDESHAHDDQGSFTLFRGAWLAIDANMQTKSGLAQAEYVHNLVRYVKGDGQAVSQSRYRASCQMKAVADNTYYSYASANMQPMYASDSGVVRAERRFLFIKPGVFVVFDPVQTSGSGMKRIWTLNVPNNPTISGNRLTYTQGSNSLDVYRMSPTVATVNVTDWKSIPPADWSEEMVSDATARRVDVIDASGDSSTFLHVMGTGGVISGSPVPSNASGQVGVQFNTNDGRSITVRFNTTGEGGSIQIKKGTVVLLDQNLPTTVQSLPLFAN